MSTRNSEVLRLPHLLEKKVSVLFFLSGAAISSRLTDLSFCSDSFSACTYIYIYIYIYIIEFIYIYIYIYIYGCFNGS